MGQSCRNTVLAVGVHIDRYISLLDRLWGKGCLAWVHEY